MTDTTPGGATPQPRKNSRRERRRDPRGSTKVRCFANALGLGRNVAVTLRNVSETGIQLITAQPLPPQRELEVILEDVSGRLVKLPAEVVWSRELPDGTCLVGARFAKSMAYTDLLFFARD